MGGRQRPPPATRPPVLTPPSRAQIAERAAVLRRQLDAAADEAGRDPAAIRIVAVTKTWPVAVCQAAYDAGLSMLGENRVQEALPKVAAVRGATWHLVGHLQSNKVRPGLDAFDWIHAVDSVALLRRIEALAHDAGRSPRLLLQVNVTDEPQKAGFAPGALGDPDLLAAIGELRHATLVGLMTIARLGADARPAFARLRALRDELEQRAGIGLPELSMGMSADVLDAVREGATLVRIGTALFGTRG